MDSPLGPVRCSCNGGPADLRLRLRVDDGLPMVQAMADARGIGLQTTVIGKI